MPNYPSPSLACKNEIDGMQQIASYPRIQSPGLNKLAYSVCAGQRILSWPHATVVMTSGTVQWKFASYLHEIICNPSQKGTVDCSKIVIATSNQGG